MGGRHPVLTPPASPCPARPCRQLSSSEVDEVWAASALPAGVCRRVSPGPTALIGGVCNSTPPRPLPWKPIVSTEQGRRGASSTRLSSRTPRNEGTQERRAPGSRPCPLVPQFPLPRLLS